MAAAALECPGCKAPLLSGLESAPNLQRCEACGTRLRVAAFPALLRPREEGRTGMTAVAAGEATCFHHDQKRAVATCEACGKFLCPLCDVEVGSAHFCTGCFALGARKGGIPEFERSRLRFDRVVWTLVLVSLLIWPLTLFPVIPLAALVIGFLKRNAPPSLVARSRLRMTIAMAIAALQVFGACLFWAAMWASSS